METLLGAFKAEVQPVEIAAALQRELDDHAAAVDGDRNTVPNLFVVDLSSRDFERLMSQRRLLGTFSFRNSQARSSVHRGEVFEVKVAIEIGDQIMARK